MDLSLKFPFLRKRETGEPYLGDSNEQLVTLVHGRHYYAARQNRLYVAVPATGGIALIIAATTGGHPTLWNPQGSGRVLSIKRLTLGYVSGANAPGSLAWHKTEKAGSTVAAAAPIKTATKVDVENAMVGGPLDSKAYWSPTTNTFLAAPVYHRPIGLSLFTGLAATATIPFPLIEEYDDDLLIAEGAAISLVTQQATTTALLRYTILFEEKDA